MLVVPDNGKPYMTVYGAFLKKRPSFRGTYFVKFRQIPFRVIQIPSNFVEIRLCGPSVRTVRTDRPYERSVRTVTTDRPYGRQGIHKERGHTGAQAPRKRKESRGGWLNVGFLNPPPSALNMFFLEFVLQQNMKMVDQHGWILEFRAEFDTLRIRTG